VGSVAQMDQPRLRRWGGAIAVSYPGEVGEAMRRWRQIPGVNVRRA
jgi:hypothetical protein